MRNLLLVLIVTLSAGWLTAAENLEAENKVRAKMKKMYDKENDLARPKASKKHDRVTIIIDDEIEAKLEATTELENDSSHAADVSQMVMLKVDKAGNLVQSAANAVIDAQNPLKVKKDLFKIPLINASSSSDHNGTGEIERKQKFETTISGEVLEVLPNGHLIIEARRSIMVNEEKQKMIFTGRIDPKDLDENSTVKDMFVIDKCIKYDGKGAITQTTRRGWMTKIIGIFRPF